jgi:hypothetical protein
MLPYWTGIATLTAAALAALLSGISLFLTGRREDKRWKREVLVDTMVSFFDASFAYVDRAAFRAAEAGHNLEWYKDRALDAHATQLRELTRLRFLARRGVLKRAFKLHDVEDELFEHVFNEQPNEQTFEELETERSKARTKLFNASRRNLGLWNTSKIGPTVGKGPRSEEMARHAMKRQRSNKRSDQRRPLVGRRSTVVLKVSRGELSPLGEAPAEPRPRRQQPSTRP